MFSHWFSCKTPRLVPGAPREGVLTPGLRIHPIRDTFAPPDRRLTLAITAGTLILLSAGSVFLMMQREQLQVSQEHLKTISLLLDEGGDGLPPGPACAGGGKDQDQVESPTHEPMPILQALAVRTNVPEEPLDPLIAPEKLPDKSMELLTLQPGLLASRIPGQGNGVGSGLGTGIGNGLDSGLGHGRGATWIHSARGDEQLKVAMQFLDCKDYISPEYPALAKFRGISGDVVIAVTIDMQGKPVKWNVVEGDPLLADATLKVFPKWHFIPPVYKGEKVGASFEVRIRFTLI